MDMQGHKSGFAAAERGGSPAGRARGSGDAPLMQQCIAPHRGEVYVLVIWLKKLSLKSK